MIKTKINGSSVFDGASIDKMFDESLHLIDDVQKTAEVAELIDAIRFVDVDLINGCIGEIESTFGKKAHSVVLCGIGGSSLGVKAFVLPKIVQNRATKKCLFLENIDPASISHTMLGLDFSGTLFLFVSKSGSTIETVSQSEFVISELTKRGIDPKMCCAVITCDKGDSPMLRLAKKFEIKVYPWHGEVGGRFSAFTLSTLIPAGLCGVDVSLVAKAGKELDMKAGLMGAVVSHVVWQKKHDVSVMMPYSDQLGSFAAWYRQLWAESIGKEGFGSLPDVSTGTIDQHSVLQMYLGGKKNKYFTLIKIDPAGAEQDDYEGLCVDVSTSGVLPGKAKVGFADMLSAACDATAKSLEQEGCPVRMICLPCVNEYYIAKMMIDMFFETIFATELANRHLGHQISPFGQPNVEQSKKNLTQAVLSI